MYQPPLVCTDTKVSVQSKVASVETNIRGFVPAKMLASTLITHVPTEPISDTFHALFNLYIIPVNKALHVVAQLSPNTIAVLLVSCVAPVCVQVKTEPFA